MKFGKDVVVQHLMCQISMLTVSDSKVDRETSYKHTLRTSCHSHRVGRGNVDSNRRSSGVITPNLEEQESSIHQHAPAEDARERRLHVLHTAESGLAMATVSQTLAAIVQTLRTLRTASCGQANPREQHNDDSMWTTLSISVAYFNDMFTKKKHVPVFAELFDADFANLGGHSSMRAWPVTSRLLHQQTLTTAQASSTLGVPHSKVPSPFIRNVVEKHATQ